MALGTSPFPLGAALWSSAGAERLARAVARARVAWASWRAPSPAWGPNLVRTLAALYLGALAALLMTAWGSPEATGASLASGVAQGHIAFLMLTGAAIAAATLRSRKSQPEGGPEPESRAPLTGLGDLLAQMSHELRTPLNAVIGFSEMMRHELYGPLGNARYQQYAHHISESGGRVLKSSEDALAVAEAMTVLLARRPEARRERLSAGSLVREAWRAAGADAARLVVTTCNTCEIIGERRATEQALQHLLGEALLRVSGDGAVEVVGQRRAGARSLLIRVGDQDLDSSAKPRPGDNAYTAPQPGGLRTMLARLLLEAQGAELAINIGTEGTWSALITFGKASS